VKCGAYGRVLALDYSEAMLQETARRIREEEVPMDALTLCRADVAALPLRPASIDALHAGAAMHCWPRLEDGLRQIRLALRPGGRFFATTFFQGAYGAGMPRQSGGGSFRFFADEAELEALLVAAGFDADHVTVRREGRGCAIIKAVVPELVETPSEFAQEAPTESTGVAAEVPIEQSMPQEAAVDAAEEATTEAATTDPSPEPDVDMSTIIDTME